MMKAANTTILVAMLLFMLAMTSCDDTQQKIIGTWQSERVPIPMDDDDDEWWDEAFATLKYTFTEDGRTYTCSGKGIIAVDDENGHNELKFNLNEHGKWTLKDGILVNTAAVKPNVDISYYLDGYKVINDELNEMIKEMKEGILEDVTESESYKVLSVDENKMVLLDLSDNTTITFTKVL